MVAAWPTTPARSRPKQSRTGNIARFRDIPRFSLLVFIGLFIVSPLGQVFFITSVPLIEHTQFWVCSGGEVVPNHASFPPFIEFNSPDFQSMCIHRERTR